MRSLFLMRVSVSILFFSSCEKPVQYDGTVYTKTGTPLPNVEVRFWHGASEDAFVAEKTNDKGVFVFNKRLQKGKKVKELTVNSINGNVTRPLKAEGEKGMVVQLQ